MRRTWVVLLLSALALPGLACGDDDDGRARARPQLTVAAAAPFKAAFTAYGKAFREGRATFEFADSDALGARIRKGATPDVFAAASTELPAALNAEGRVSRPVTFASDELVLATRYGAEDQILDLDDVAKRGIRVAIGAKSLPVGRFTRTVLDRLPRSRREAILANVRSQEPNVAGILARVASGAVDVAFVYRSQLRLSSGKLVEARLSVDLRPFVEYSVVIVGGARQPAVAKAFIYGLLADVGKDAVQRASFGAPLYRPAPKPSP